jgi:dihydroneopterin triphosphate diphosphatase
VHTDDLRILLLRRISPFDFWQSVTGSLDPGELPVDTARRELFEETGLSDEGQLIDTGISRLFTIDSRWLHRYPPGVTENREYEWRYRLPSPVNIRIDRHEHSACQWLPVDEAIDLVWSWTNREALERLRERLL